MEYKKVSRLRYPLGANKKFKQRKIIYKKLDMKFETSQEVPNPKIVCILHLFCIRICTRYCCIQKSFENLEKKINKLMDKQI